MSPVRFAPPVAALAAALAVVSLRPPPLSAQEAAPAADTAGTGRAWVSGVSVGLPGYEGTAAICPPT